MYDPMDRHTFWTLSYSDYEKKIKMLEKENKMLEEENKVLRRELETIRQAIFDDVGNPDYTGICYIDGHWCVPKIANDTPIKVKFNGDIKINGDILYKDIVSNKTIAVRHHKKSSGGK